MPRTHNTYGLKMSYAERRRIRANNKLVVRGVKIVGAVLASYCAYILLSYVYVLISPIWAEEVVPKHPPKYTSVNVYDCTHRYDHVKCNVVITQHMYEDGE